MTVLSIDFETASECDLKRAGTHAYAMHPTTRVLCMAWAFGSEPVRVWRLGERFPQSVIDHVSSRWNIVRSWNVAFEHEVWNETLDRSTGESLPYLREEQLEDTMARAAYWGLPLGLDQAGPAINLPIVKDAAGHALMLRMCRPRGRRADGSATWWHEDSPERFDRLCAYCATDVEAERLIAGMLPPLPETEARLWQMDRRINMRGVAVDLQLAERLRAVTAAALVDLNREMHGLTGATTTQTSKLMAWLRTQGWTGADLRKGTVKEALAEEPPGVVRQVLTLRREAAKSSVAKLNVLNTAAVASRVHGMLQYYGAARTGRWAGRLLQPQNMPRPIGDVEAAMDVIAAGATPADIELLFEDSTLGTISSCLRATLTAAPGNVLVSCDLSQIEARVVAWLAGQDDILGVFASGEDVYTYTAARIGSKSRTLGKVLVLACGFGMGGTKFQATAKTYGLVMSEDDAVGNVDAWREANPEIRRFWYACGDAAKAVAAGDKGPFFVGPQRVSFRRVGGSMFVTLPSGRELIYRRIGFTPDETGRDNLTFWGVNPLTKQWGLNRTYGGRLVENVTQATARDVMACAMLELDERGVPIVMSIHDEIIAEVPDAEGEDTLKLMRKTLRTPARWPGANRSWATGLPVDAAGWVGQRYRKG